MISNNEAVVIKQLTCQFSKTIDIFSLKKQKTEICSLHVAALYCKQCNLFIEHDLHLSVSVLLV